jgi:hypothetical protein
MANNIILKKSSVTSKVPLTSDLTFGELALNYADGKLYYKKADGTTIDSFNADITSSDVTTALGYTPYNSTNPSNYITTAGARSALSFTAGSGAYNSSTGVITIPTNNNQLTNGAGYTTNTGTVTSVGGTGTVSGLTLSGTVTSSGNLTLGGTLSLTSGQVTGALGFTPYNATNPSGYTSNTGTVTSVATSGTVSGLTLTGGTITTNGTITLGGTLSASIDNISDEHRLFNNMGDTHSTRSSFDATTPTYNFGWRFVQGSTNGPNVNSAAQYYSLYTGLGNEYAATGSGSYGMQIAFPRNVSNPYLAIRYNENNSLGAWQKVSAGYADSSGNAATVTNGVYTNTGQRISGIKQFDNSNSGMANSSGGLATLEAYGTGGGAFAAFHRPGVYAAYFGIDSDNVWKVGGWSMGNVAYPILHSNNYTSYSPSLTGSGASGTWGISITGNAANVTGTVAVSNGGTGATSLTANNVLLGNGTSQLQVVAPGTSGNVLTSNGTTWTSAAGATGGPTLTAIASGSLSDGSTVIVNADGTVSVAATIAQSVGTPAVFESANTSLICATYDSINQRVVIAYRDNGNGSYGTAIIGTVSNTSITFGTAVVFASTVIVATSITYDSTNQKVVIAYTDGSSSKAIVGTVSGTSISFGTAVVFDTAATDVISATYDSTNEKVVIAYRDIDRSSNGTAIVGTVSGTSISFGTAVVFESASTSAISAAYDSTNQKVIIAYRDVGNINYGTAIVGTVSGTSISFGTAVVFESASTSAISAAYDSTNQKVVIAYSDGGNSSYGTAIVGTVSGTSISFGTAVVFESANTGPISAVYDSSVRKVVIAYRDVGNSGYGTIIVGTVSSTSISFGTAVVFESASTPQLFSTYDSTNQKVVIAYRDEGNSDFGTAVVFRNQSTNLTTENFIGFSNAAYTNGETATIQIVGAVDDAQSGLTPGQSYFVQNNGTLGLAPANPSVFAGTAVASNKIIVKG